MAITTCETRLSNGRREPDASGSRKTGTPPGESGRQVSDSGPGASTGAEGASLPALTPELVFVHHFDFVWRSLRRLGVAASTLDDATQEVFVVVCRRLDSVNTEAQLRSWLFAIATHVACKARRTAQRRGADPLPEVLADECSLSPQESAAQAEALRTVYALLEHLSPPQRAVFVMAELEQFTAPEIAAALDLPLNTVYSRLRSARATFEAALWRHRARTGEAHPIGTESP
jgi:RNA polymerase sigma-70 factor (ECF subfamily)